MYSIKIKSVSTNIEGATKKIRQSRASKFINARNAINNN